MRKHGRNNHPSRALNENVSPKSSRSSLDIDKRIKQECGKLMNDQIRDANMMIRGNKTVSMHTVFRDSVKYINAQNNTIGQELPRTLTPSILYILGTRLGPWTGPWGPKGLTNPKCPNGLNRHPNDSTDLRTIIDYYKQ